ncbi:hypothetical protein [Streptomyces sp. NPDC049915]|uniref:hypothetical protein n=1 Tax=Streptomyces sp. NPDC049915 TaxID=3155510 RepID=UPI003423180C
MTYRQAVIPATVGAIVLVALLWWAGSCTQALELQGASTVIGGRPVAELQRWLGPWSYDPPGLGQSTGAGTSVDGARYLRLYHTGVQIRFGALFAFFLAGALLVIRRLPPAHGRTPVSLVAVWAWGPVAGTLAVTVSAPWFIAAQGHGSYRFLPQLASVISTGRQIVVVGALVAAAVTVLTARITAKGAGPRPYGSGPAPAARLAATAGTAVVAFSVLVLSYVPVAARIQSISPRIGLLSEPGDLLRQWLLLSAWAAPGGSPLGDWLLNRAGDVLLLGVVWWSLRKLPALLTRVTVPAMALCSVCATSVGLLVGQVLHAVTAGGDLAYLVAGIGEGIPAAVTCGGAAGVVAAVTLRVAAGRVRAPVEAPADSRPAG